VTQKQNVRSWLIVGLVCLSLGGWLLHTRIHAPEERLSNWIPFIAGLLSTFLIPLLFVFRKTSTYAYVLNGMLAIVGTVTMGYFSLGNLPDSLTFRGILLNTLLADIVLVWTKFALGKAIFELDLLKTSEDHMRKGRFWRYPNMGFWWAHLLGMSLVFALGVVFWK
jgi:putative flippase GtrA